MKQCLVKIIAAFSILCLPSLFGEIKGAVDVGAVLMRIDVLNYGKTDDTLHMKGVKADATIALYEGFSIKPTCLFGWGDGTLSSGSLAAGYYAPCGYINPCLEGLSIFPNIGVNASYLSTSIDYNVPDAFVINDVRERFRSEGVFAGIDLYYRVTKKITLSFSYQYVWSKSHTKFSLKHDTLFTSKSHACGPNYAIGLDYSLNCNWSVVAGAAYNISLSKEKHGLRGAGGKVGVAYYF